MDRFRTNHLHLLRLTEQSGGTGADITPPPVRTRQRLHPQRRKWLISHRLSARVPPSSPSPESQVGDERLSDLRARRHRLSPRCPMMGARGFRAFFNLKFTALLKAGRAGYLLRRGRPGHGDRHSSPSAPRPHRSLQPHVPAHAGDVSACATTASPFAPIASGHDRAARRRDADVHLMPCAALSHDFGREVRRHPNGKHREKAAMCKLLHLPTRTSPTAC